MDAIPSAPRTARYIKLGSADDKATQRCLDDGEAFVHFGTSSEESFADAREKRWDAFRDRRLTGEKSRVERREITPSAAEANATSAKNQVKAFVEAGRETLWFTFHMGKLYWAFLDPALPDRPDDRGFVRKVQDSWRCTDISGTRSLLFSELSGRLTRTAAYRGTTCEVPAEARDYLWRRLHGVNPQESQDARDTRDKLVEDLGRVISKFTFKDFELLAELVLTSVGWRRLSLTGSAMPFVDTVLEQPLDRRVIGAQVKAVLKADDVESYGAQYRDAHSAAVGGAYQALYFVYHTDPGNVASTYEKRDRLGNREISEVPGMLLMGPEQVASLAIRAGLVDWIIERIE